MIVASDSLGVYTARRRAAIVAAAKKSVPRWLRRAHANSNISVGVMKNDGSSTCHPNTTSFRLKPQSDSSMKQQRHSAATHSAVIRPVEASRFCPNVIIAASIAQPAVNAMACLVSSAGAAAWTVAIPIIQHSPANAIVAVISFVLLFIDFPFCALRVIFSHEFFRKAIVRTFAQSCTLESADSR